VPKPAAKPAAKPAPPKATAKPAVAEAAPAVKPARPTVPAQTKTSTRFKDSAGRTLKTVTKRGETTTTTQFKSPAAQTSTPVNNPANSGTTTVYRSINPVTQEVQYVGITDDLARRELEHMRERGFFVDKVIGGLSRIDARAVEQALIETHGLGKNGGTLLNKINSIAKTNPDLAQLLQKGYDLLKAAEYKM
jgi:hypothetical protein